MSGKKKYIAPEARMIEAEIECNQYWQSGWRNDDGKINEDNDPSYHKTDDQYWKSGGAKESSPIWDN